jgi:hypothetical protein
MSDACNQTPFWQRQPVLPKGIQDFLRVRMEAALEDPGQRHVLAWPTVLAAPGIRQAHPAGLPEALLLQHAEPMLRPLGLPDPGAVWRMDREAWLDTAIQGAGGWLPHAAWGAWGPLVSLRCGWALAALTPLPTGDSYPMASGVSLFNHGLYHECHDALEPLWTHASGEFKNLLQGLILMAAGYYHLQLANPKGMVAVWEEALVRLKDSRGQAATPWGDLSFGEALDLTARRLDHVKRTPDEADLATLWNLDRPTWSLS